jgi:uncharacterized membrane protein YfcA
VSEPFDWLKITEAAAAAAAAALVVLLLPPPRSRPGLAGLRSVLATGAGLIVGWWVMGVRPHWPAGEALDRLLLLLFPAAFVTEMLASTLNDSKSRRWLAWVLRLVVVVAAARILLHGSSLSAHSFLGCSIEGR